TRFALAIIPLVGLILAMGIDAVLRRRGWARLAVFAAVLVGLAPIVPAPLPTTHRPPVPRFFTEGYWRTCAHHASVIVPVPPPSPEDPHSMRWAAAADAQFALPEGFFIGPYADGSRAA